MDATTASIYVAGVLTGLMAFSVATLLIVTGPGRLLNLTGALTLFGLGLNAGIWPFGVLGPPDSLMGAQLRYWAVLPFGPVIFLYLVFIGQAVPSPLAAPLRTLVARYGLLGVAVLVLLVGLASPSVFATYEQGTGIRYTPLLLHLLEAFLVVGGFALVTAFDAYRRAALDSIARRRAGLYLIAFGLSDLAIIFAIGVGVYNRTHPIPQPLYLFLQGTITNIPQIIGFAVLGWALLRWSLFGAELKVKWTIRRGTVAAVFLGVFFVVAQIAQAWLTRGQNWFAGAAAAGLLLFALSPLQNAAQRVADRALPGVAPTPEYAVYRKLELYRAAVESALESGGIDARERSMLDRLCAKLGVAPADARVVESDVTARLAAP